MKSRLQLFILYFLYWLIVFVLQKPIFLLFQICEANNYSLFDWFSTIIHGLSMDVSMTSYFMLLPTIFLFFSCFFSSSEWFKKAMNVYTYILIMFVAIVFVSDIFLYKYWGFRIDTTPLFYLRTPKDALASGTAVEYIVSFFVLLSYIFLLVKLYSFVFRGFNLVLSKLSFKSSFVFLILFPFLFLLIRGGVGVSTMNASYVYFSESTFLNHSAINPIWNFLNSCTKSTDFAKQYRFMDDREAIGLVNKLNRSHGANLHESLLCIDQPNIFLIIMEGIGSNMIEALGGKKGVTPNLNKYTKEGVCFSRFYASSFRTDRGLVAILSGYPAQPTNSLMKFPRKTQHIPIITQYLRTAGYSTSFYYGGDDNFTNLRSYLITAGYQNIVNKHDFKGADMSTKWGAYDHVVFNRVKTDLTSSQEPFFKTILTLNSHEPFDVPSSMFDEPYPNSVFYADSCIGDFIEDLKKREIWDRTLVIILPDHAFRYPSNIDNSDPWRYSIPMIWMGGAVSSAKYINKVCCQVDLAATLLNQLHLPSNDFIFSHDIMCESHPKYAFYSFIDGFGLITEADTVRFDCGGNRIIYSTNPETLLEGKAYLQELYSDIARR